MADGRLIRVPEWFAAPQSQFPNVEAALRNPRSSIAEAEAHATHLGVPAQYGSSLQIANMVNEVLTQLMERNLPLFSSVLILADFFREFGQESKNVAA